MAKREICPDCDQEKFVFLIRKGADGKVRCDACETARLRKPVKVKATWADIKARRAKILLSTDWIETEGGKARAGKKLTADLLKYRQDLFELTDNFAAPKDVIWPKPPKEII